MAQTKQTDTEDHPGPFKRFIRAIFGFRKTTLTLLLVLTYIVSIAIAIYFEEAALKLPNPEPETLKKSWLDLQMITEQPHCYTSHGNDVVHAYLSKRAQQLSATKKYISFSDDWGSHRSMINQHDVFDPDNTDNRVIYFESGNILVKVQGKNPSLEGMLVSAHYDSVPASHGATDDGMGIATMLGILEELADVNTPQPERTIVFNFNDDEEFGLLGAEMFFKHPWSRSVKYFVNLDGAGAGGRAVLLRTTDAGILNYYRNADRPFANSIFQQGFKAGGLVHSETDYHVYAGNGLRGIDIDFYSPRSLYHTIRDSIAETSKGSLWHMQTNTRSFVFSLAFNSDPVSEDYSPAIYFDLLGIWFVSVPLPPFLIINIILAAAVPCLAISLLLVIYRKKTWFIDGKGWLRLPGSMAGSAVVTYFAAKYFYLHDPLLVSADYFSPLMALSSLDLLCNYIVLNFFAWAGPVHDQKLICLLELTIMFWIFLVWSIIAERDYSNVALYPVTALYCLFSVATLFGLCGLALKSRPVPYERTIDVPEYGSTSSPEPEASEPANAEAADTAPAATPTESTPLQSSASTHSASHKASSSAKSVSFDPLSTDPAPSISSNSKTTPAAVAAATAAARSRPNSSVSAPAPAPAPAASAARATPAPSVPSPAVTSENHPLLSLAAPEPLSASEPQPVPPPEAPTSSKSSKSKFGLFSKVKRRGQEIEDDIDYSKHRASYNKKLKQAALKSFDYDWSLQFLIVVPLSAFILFWGANLALEAIHQTGQDSAQNGLAVTKFLVAASVSLAIPVLPFAHKLNSGIIMFFALVFIVSSTICYFEPPFTHSAPLKLRFLESIDLGSQKPVNASLAAEPVPVVSLYGRSGYIKPMLSDIPSLEAGIGQEIQCDVNAKLQTETCRYEARRPWLADGTLKDNKFSKYMSIETVSNDNKGKSMGKFDPLFAVFKIKLHEGRQCVLKFNTTEYSSDDETASKIMSPVKLVTVYNPDAKHSKGGSHYGPIRANIPSGYSMDDDGNHYFKLMKGIDSVQLHKLNWTQPEFDIGIQWLPFSLDDDNDPVGKRHLGISVDCFWGDYDTQVVVDGLKRRILPAYDELLQYTPDDLLLTNLQPGLLQISEYFEL